MLKMNGLRRSGTKDTSIIDFILGVVLIVIGLHAIFKNTSVVSSLFGTRLSTGMVTIPIIIAIVILVLNHKSRIGWGLLGVGIILLLISLVCSVRIVFHSTSLWQYLVMFGGTFGGIGLLLRALLR